MKIFFSLFVALQLLQAEAQTYQNEAKLIEYLGAERFQKLDNAGSGYLKFLDARLSYGFAIIEYVPEKMNEFIVLNELQKTNPADKSVSQVSVQDFIDEISNGTVNYLLYQLAWDQNAYTYYRLGTTNQVLVIYSNEYITKKMNQ